LYARVAAPFDRNSSNPERGLNVKMPVQIITSWRLLLFKFVLFLTTGVMAGALILVRTPELSSAFLLVACVWAFARAYYFCFYVIERYVDSRFRFSGVCAAVRFGWSAVRGGREGSGRKRK
jgi:hypothetical protein